MRRGKDRESVLLEGARVIDEALDAGVDLEFLLYAEQEDAKTQQVRERAAEAGVATLAVDAGLLADGSDLDAPAGVLAVAQRPDGELDAVIAQAARAGDLVLVAAGVQDPGNVGALIRVAAGLGAGAVVLLHGSASAWHPRSVRGASGTCFRLPIAEGVAVEHFLSACAEHALPVWTTAADGEDYRGQEPGACALVLGEEGRGVPAGVLEAGARRIGIPLTRSVESLNVATAAAVLLAALAPGGQRQ